MEHCPLNNAFGNRPYCQVSREMFETPTKYDKTNLFRSGDYKVDQSKIIRKYESPMVSIDENTFIEGKWRVNPNDRSSDYPFPFMHDKPFFDKEFVNDLNAIMNANKKYVCQFNERQKCVLCSQPLGNMEYFIQKGNTKFRFDNSIIHYYMTHNVWPSKEFYQFIKDY
jgi:hypothetical protein